MLPLRLYSFSLWHVAFDGLRRRTAATRTARTEAVGGTAATRRIIDAGRTCAGLQRVDSCCLLKPSLVLALACSQKVPAAFTWTAAAQQGCIEATPFAEWGSQAGPMRRWAALRAAAGGIARVCSAHRANLPGLLNAPLSILAPTGAWAQSVFCNVWPAAFVPPLDLLWCGTPAVAG